MELKLNAQQLNLSKPHYQKVMPVIVAMAALHQYSDQTIADLGHVGEKFCELQDELTRKRRNYHAWCRRHTEEALSDQDVGFLSTFVA